MRQKKRKGIEAQRVKHPIPSQATDALTGEKEQNRKQKKRKGIEAQRVKHPIPSQATDALTGEKEQNRKQKKTKGKKVTYDVLGSYGEPMLFNNPSPLPGP